MDEEGMQNASVVGGPVGVAGVEVPVAAKASYANIDAPQSSDRMKRWMLPCTRSRLFIW